ncbi:MAG: glutamate synthase [Planctomycetota bacterium]|nr:MAG: glutamate synthase [Planctomycetota bacterium]REK23566.1 MAG: glutamate synthase [Planctomycetota bacterium]
MASPKVAGKQPVKIDLETGEHHWCACGHSKSQPFCDGSHRGTGIEPLAFTVDEPQEGYLCLCKRTRNPPYCDGSHVHFDAKQVEEPVAKDVDGMPKAQNTPEEPTVELIHALARDGLEKTGHHGPLAAMGVPRPTLPQWDDIQVLTAQLAKRPLLEDSKVGTDIIIGPNAKKPLRLEIPIFVSDMSFGALSEEAKVAMSRGAEMAGTGICSGEGGMLPEEQAENSRYFYELASAKFGYSEDLLPNVQAFHFKAGQGAKTGTGGHLPGNKVKGKIAEVRQIPEGTPAVSPPAFCEFETPKDYIEFADRVRKLTGGVPVGFKMSAQHIERDIEFALQAGADYVILDGRGGGTGAAPLIFRDNISVPTIPALARARQFLDKQDRKDVTLIITGGIRTPSDFIKALCLGADGIAIANSAMQAIGCVAARICNTNNCPAGIATQQEHLRTKLDVEKSSKQLARFLRASVQLMQVMARACGYTHLNQFNAKDITTWKKEMADLTGIQFAGVG